MIINYLKKIYGENNVKTLEFSFNDMPIFMKAYKYEYISLYNKNIMFVKPNIYDLNSYIYHSKLLINKYNCETVLILNNSKEMQRMNLIKNNIMFIEENKYIFIPFIGLAYLPNNIERNINDIKLSPKEYLVALSFVYSNKEYISSKDILKFLNSNRMEVSRSTRKLEFLGLIKREANGVGYSFKRIINKLDFINKLIDISPSPIKDIKLVNMNSIPASACLSSISAIAKHSMLEDDRVRTYAISYDEFKRLNCNAKDYFDGMIIEKDEVKLEIWNFNPNIYSLNNCAELISVIKTVKSEDDRVIDSINRVKEKIANGFRN